MTIQPIAGRAASPKYQRTVITTARQKPVEPAPAQLTVSKAEVLALSRSMKDTPWYVRRRLQAAKVFQSLPMPALTDEAWRRTDIRAFKWGEILPGALEPAALSSKRVPASLLKPLVGGRQGGRLVAASGYSRGEIRRAWGEGLG